MVRAGLGHLQSVPYVYNLDILIAGLKAIIKTLKAPDIIGVHGGARQLPAKSQIFAVGRFSLGNMTCLLYTSPSPRDGLLSRMPSSA